MDFHHPLCPYFSTALAALFNTTWEVPQCLEAGPGEYTCSSNNRINTVNAVSSLL